MNYERVVPFLDAVNGNHVISRRTAVRLLVTTAFSLPALTSDSTQINIPTKLIHSDPIFPNSRELSQEELIAKITSFETEKGYRRLTFEEAKAIVPIIAAAYTKAPPKARSNAEFLTERIFIVRGYENDAQKATDANSDFSTNFAVRQFMQDYPGVHLTEDDKKRIGKYALGGNVAGWVGDKGAYVLLTNINDVINKNAYVENTGRLRNTEWEEVPLGNGSLSCQPSSPAVFFRGAIFHELKHLDSRERGKTQPFSDSIIRAYNYLWHEYNLGSFFYFPDGYSWQFGVALNVKHGMQSMGLAVNNTGLLEFSTDTIAAMKTFALGLDYVMPAYDMKPDYENFISVIRQAGITNENFAQLYYDSQLEIFYDRIAKGAKNIQFDAYLDELIFSIMRLTLENRPIPAFIKFSWGSSFGPDWRKYKEYYPGVDATQYQYTDRFTERPPKNHQWVCVAPILKK